MTSTSPSLGANLALNLPARPSHPSPHKAARHGLHAVPPGAIKPPGHLHKPPSRPRLRIITNDTPILRVPLARHHPGMIKTAPLAFSAPTDALLSFIFPAKPTANDTATIHCDNDDIADNQAITVRPDQAFLPPPPRQSAHYPPSRNGAGRHGGHVTHKRKLSDKFKSLFSALHLKKDDCIPFFQPDLLSTTSSRNGSVEILALKNPLRPHRSPGTASFLVSRHLTPDPSLPTSAHSSSTAFSTVSRPTFAERRKLYFDSRLEISHFSNPTSLASATGSGTGRSASSSVVLDKSPGGLGTRLRLNERVRWGSRMRKCRSLPDLKVLRSL